MLELSRRHQLEVAWEKLAGGQGERGISTNAYTCGDGCQKAQMADLPQVEFAGESKRIKGQRPINHC